jgi:hypothetical protein
MRQGFVPGATLALLMALVVYDLIGRRPGRLVSILGALFVFAAFTTAIMVSGTPFGLDFARALT